MSAFQTLGVVGAGNMGSGIAQKMATEGFTVILVDVDDAKVARGLGIIEQTLKEGVERKVFTQAAADAARARLRGTSRFEDLAGADLVVEAVFEDRDVKKDVFRRLEAVCRPDAILGTNTSSYAVTELAGGARGPERILGLHYFYHPAKNRLVEVIPGKQTSPEVVRRAWTLQELLGKTPIASADAHGFVVNRYFVPWLVEAVRLLEEGLGTIATIDDVARKTFRIGMGPFELMNVTGVPIALHAATTLGEAFGPMYAPAPRLETQVESGKTWDLAGEIAAAPDPRIADRLLAVTFLVASSLVDEGVSTMEDADIGARVGLRWSRGPFEMMNAIGIERAASLVTACAQRWGVAVPAMLTAQAATRQPFRFTLVREEVRDAVATLTLNRPDAMNALNEAVVEQLGAAFRRAAAAPDVKGIVIAGAGKAFIAGADIRFFVRNIEANRIDDIVRFTRAGQELLRAIETCPKPVVAKVDGLALGGGLELALACHRIVAVPKAVMAFPETGIGIYPGLGGTQRTARRVGRGLTRWLIFTGQMIGAEEALAIGLVDRVVPPEEIDMAVAEAIAAGPVAERRPAAVPATHRALAAIFADSDVEALRQGTVDAGSDERVVRAVKRVQPKAPIALKLASDLVDASATVPIERGLEMELERLPQIFATTDALAGLKSVGGPPPKYRGE